jgi:hypothetical protein
MITGLNPKETFELVSVLDKDAENPTKFVLGMITGEDRVVLMSNFEPDNINPSYYYALVRKGLKAIKNFKTTEGVRDINEITDAVLDTIPIAVIKEMFQQLLKMNFLSGDEEKN